MGPNVGTCVCAMCNDFGIETEGEFKDNAQEYLNKVHCDEDRWENMSSLEKRFRHIFDVNQWKKDTDPERYFISEHGLQNEVNKECGGKIKKWVWWKNKKPEDRDFSTARVFVCDACSTPKTGHPSHVG